MIQLSKEEMSLEVEAKLRRWLSQPEAGTLVRVAGAHCQLLLADALNKTLTASKGAPSDLLSQDDMREASRFQHFLEIFSSFMSRAKDDRFFTAKLIQTPAITNANTIEDSGPSED